MQRLGADEPPEGWEREPIGTWNGYQAEVVHDPRRHDYLLVRGSAADDIDGGLAHAGYQFQATDGRQWLWTRDRLDAARARIARTDRPPALEATAALTPPTPTPALAPPPSPAAGRVL